jgi:hypothetical protein
LRRLGDFSPKSAAAPWGIYPRPPQKERRRGREGGARGEGTGGRPWEDPRSPPRWTATSPPACRQGRRTGNARAWTVEPEQFKSPTPEAGAARGSCPSPWSRNRTDQGRRRPCLYLHRPFTEPNRLHPSSPSSSTPPRRNAKERGCCTRETSLWKPWTAPPCFLCSRPFHAARHHLLAAVSRARGEH